MRRLVARCILTLGAAVALILWPAPAGAQGAPYRTNEDYVACLTLDAYNEQTEILVSGDRRAWAAYIADRRNGCIILKDGVPVHMANAKGWGVIKIRPEGSTLWLYTATEAIRRA